ncbi:phage tail assembly protein [Arsenophonus sp. PmNCSU2021_1]|uniref:phage tail assembly protein n=1 Tax=Arsenophonus sp. PmNCSU2021_1 TaxID=3118989 RepID=UPI002FEE88E4
MKKTPNTRIINLEEPIARGETPINQVTLRKPHVGDLRGVQLSPLMQMDVDAVMKVLPRIMTPSLNEQEMRQMSPGDFFNLANELGLFLLPKSVTADFPIP